MTSPVDMTNGYTVFVMPNPTDRYSYVGPPMTANYGPSHPRWLYHATCPPCIVADPRSEAVLVASDAGWIPDVNNYGATAQVAAWRARSGGGR
jgi:hypothetical protein